MKQEDTPAGKRPVFILQCDFITERNLCFGYTNAKKTEGSMGYVCYL
jgi:hypothetical protein